ncbi:MAG TPA: ATP-binding protein [Actinomycetota bacterium]|nr:ATP-binding protein [Actinomycetota bacterium]
MEDLVEVIGYINNALYVALAVAAFRSWRRQGGSSSAWVAATFGTLATIAAVSLILGDDAEGTAADIATTIVLIGIAFFAYALYRFTASLRGPSPTIDKLAMAATGAVMLFTLFLGEIPEEGEPRTTKFQIYLIALLLQWGGLLVTVAVRLWRAGKGQPTLARRRMRLLSLASVGMTLILVVGAAQTDQAATAVDVVSGLMATLSVIFFFLGFTPPAIVRIAWRRPEQEALNAATARLVSASTDEEVTQTLLPHVASILGARAAILVDTGGEVIGSFGELPEGTGARSVPARAPTEERVEANLLRLEFDFGSLVIWASPYTPFFGQEEVELLRNLGGLTGLALDRTKLFRSEQEARASAEVANQKLQEANVGLIESQSRLAEAQGIAHIGSFNWNVATNEVEWSSEMFRIFGVEPGTIETTYESYFSYVHQEDTSFVDSVVTKAVEERRAYSFDHRVVRPDGTVRVVHARGQVEVDEKDVPVRVVGTAQDVTAAREAERRIASALSNERDARRSLERLNQEMETFVYTVSHDLNSPIIAIQGFSDFLSKDFGEVLPEKGQFYIERIRVSAGYLQSLIKDLLSFSRIGRVQTEIEEVSLTDIVTQAGDEVTGQFPGFRLDAVPLPTVHMNPLRARQLFTNLMQNSCRYSGRADTWVKITCERSEGQEVHISVQDNGPGIPKEFRDKAFGVFERLQEGGPSEGTGMGLPICRKIVESAGGRMWIEDSTEGLDVHFTLQSVEPIEGETL